MESSRTVIACSHCRSRKTRCNGRAPCEACSRRSLQCSLSHQGNPKNARTMRMDSIINELQDDQYDQKTRSTAEDRMDCTPPWKGAKVLQYVEIYFEEFHPVWPFLHRATFEPSLEPPILLQSVVMMGLWMTGDEEMQCHAVKLHDKLSSLVYEQRVSNSPAFPFDYPRKHSKAMSSSRAADVNLIGQLGSHKLRVRSPKPLAHGNIPSHPSSDHFRLPQRHS